MDTNATNDFFIKIMTRRNRRREDEEESERSEAMHKYRSFLKQMRDETGGGEFEKECDHQCGEPQAKTQCERQPNRENSASLCQFKLGKEKAREGQDNETLENDSTRH